MPSLIRHFGYSEMGGVVAGFSAGVATEADLNGGLPGPPSKTSLTLSAPATWSYIWVILSFAYLFSIYFGMIRIERRG